jgi:cytochrome b
MDGASPTRRLWDWPVRLVHLGLILLVPALWWTQDRGLMEWHQRAGLLLLGLVLFRLLWGLVGSDTARFARFLAGPARLAAYLRSGRWAGLGHNPLGGWSVLALLSILLVQAGLGLFASDTDGLVYGPLNHLVSYGTAEEITDLHELGFNILLAFIALHVSTVILYFVWKGDNLIGPMITGRKPLAELPPEAADLPLAFQSPARALLLLGICFALIWWIARGLPIPG